MQDTFCYVHKNFHPDLFVMFTTNPKWEKILHELHLCHSSQDCHDLVARVFYLKLKKLMDLLVLLTVYASLCIKYRHEQLKLY